MKNVSQRLHLIALFALGLSLAGATGTIGGEGAPQFVVPGRPSVPVIINGYDARWAVVEGEFGLDRPGHMDPTVIGGRYVGPYRGWMRPSGYFPTTGEKPARGRVEGEAPINPQAPTQAEDFSRSWGANSMSQPVPPADLPNPNAGPMGEGVPGNPPIIVVPQVRPRRRP